MSDWVKSRCFSDAEMREYVLPCFSDKTKLSWACNNNMGSSYLMRREKPEFVQCVQYPGDLCTVVFICYNIKNMSAGLFTRERLNVLEEGLASIDAFFK